MPLAAPAALPTLELTTWHDAGFLILRQVAQADEIRVLAAEAAAAIERACVEHPQDGDHFYGRTGIPWRIEWAIDKMPSFRQAWGNPRILAAIDGLLGPGALMHTLYTMVFKAPGGGAEVSWHRDWQEPIPGAPTDWQPTRHLAACTLALDPWTEEDAMWMVPGSHHWSRGEADAWAKSHRTPFTTDGAVPTLLERGDLLIHNHYTLHGSRAGNGVNLRRGLQCTFWSQALWDFTERNSRRDLQRGRRRQVQATCLWQRRFRPWAQAEAAWMPSVLTAQDLPLDERASCRCAIQHFADFQESAR